MTHEAEPRTRHFFCLPHRVLHFHPFCRCTLLNFKIMSFSYFVPKLFFTNVIFLYNETNAFLLAFQRTTWRQGWDEEAYWEEKLRKDRGEQGLVSHTKYQCVTSKHPSGPRPLIPNQMQFILGQWKSSVALRKARFLDLTIDIKI